MNTEKEFLEKIETERKNFKSKTFNRGLCEQLFADYLNTPDLVSEEFKEFASKHELKITRNKPVKEFRKFLMGILIKFGIDKDEAKRVIHEIEFSPKESAAIIPMFNNFIYHYLQTGKKYELFSKREVKSALELRNKEKEVKTTKQGNKYNYDDYSVIASKSTCPNWRKHKLDDLNTDAEAVLKEVVEDIFD